jgi:hypothetical protein
MDNAQTKIKWYVKLLPFIYDQKRIVLKQIRIHRALEKSYWQVTLTG